MRHEKTDTTETLHFDTLGEALSFSQQHQPDDHTGNRIDPSPSWDNDTGFAGAVHAAEHGWPEGLARITKMAASIDVCNKVHKPEVYFDVVGEGGWDMGAVMAGLPEVAIAQRDSELQIDSPNGPVVKIGVNLCASAGITADVITARGAAMAALVDALETAGKRVELWLLCSFARECGRNGDGTYTGYGDKLIYEIVIKQAHESLSLDKLAFMLAHPAMFRRIIFAMFPGTDMGKQSVFRSMKGYPSEHPESAQFDVYLASAMWKTVQWASPASARAWVLGQLAGFGVSVDGEGGQP